MWFCAESTSFVYTLCLCTAISQNENDKVPLLEDTEPHPNPLTVGTSNKVRNWILITICVLV